MLLSTMWLVSTWLPCHCAVSTLLPVTTTSRGPRAYPHVCGQWRSLPPFHLSYTALISPLLCSALLPPFGSPSPATTTFSRCRPSRASALLSSPLPLASAFGPSHRPMKPGSTVHRPLLPTHEFTVDRRHPCTSGPATTLRRTARARSSSTSTPTSPMTFCLSCHRRPLCRQTPTIAQPLW
jgi:hypothetical protein